MPCQPVQLHQVNCRREEVTCWLKRREGRRMPGRARKTGREESKRPVHWPAAWSWWSAWPPSESLPAGPPPGGRTACAGRQRSAPSSGWAASGGSPHRTATQRHWSCEPGGLSTASEKKTRLVTSNNNNNKGDCYSAHLLQSALQQH